jgi:hypothetical protein
LTINPSPNIYGVHTSLTRNGFGSLTPKLGGSEASIPPKNLANEGAKKSETHVGKTCVYTVAPKIGMEDYLFK